MKNEFKILFIILMFCWQYKTYSWDKKIKIIAEETPIRSFLEDAQNDKKTAKKDPNDSKQPDSKEVGINETVQTKKLVGSDIEIVTKIFTNLKIPFEIELVHWSQMLAKIIAGEADIALGIEKNSKFAKHVIFPRLPTYTKNYSFYGLPSQLPNSYTLTFEEALAHNYSVGIIVGFSYPKVFWEAYPFENKQLNSHLIEGKSLRDNIIRLKEKKIDLIIADRERADVLLKKIGAEESIFKYKNVLFWKEFYMVFSKKLQGEKFADLKSKVDRELYKMTESEQIKEINEAWVFKGLN